MNEVISAIMKRRSTRSFQPTQIDKNDLDTILECAVNAPSACNMQSWHFTVVQDPQTIAYLNQAAKKYIAKSEHVFLRKYSADDIDLLYGAPTLIIVSGNKEGVNPVVDCSAAVENMLICAQSLGLGTLWNGLIREAFKTKAARDMLKIPKGYTVYYGIAVGYAKEGFVPPEKEIMRQGVIDYIKG